MESDDEISESSNESEQELFPIQVSSNFSPFNYNDSTLLKGILRPAVEGDCDKLKKLLCSGFSVNMNDNHGNTALHIAVLKHNAEFVKILLDVDDIRLNARNFYGETPIYLACKESQYELAELLIKHNVNLNLPNNEDITPLHLSINNVPLAHLLIRNGANLNARDYSGETPLHEAVEANNLEAVCMLLYYNADANVHCDHNLTPFMKAITREHDDIQAALIDYVVDFNDRTHDGWSLLMLALSNYSQFVKTIIDQGANVNYVNYNFGSNDEFRRFDMLEICLRFPDVDNFRLVWPKYQSQVHDTLGTVMFRLNESDLTDTPLYKEYLNVIMDSNNVEACIASAANFFDFGDIINACYEQEDISLEFLTKFAIILLQHAYPVCVADFDTVINKYGYCDLYKFMLHIEPKLVRFPIQFYFSSVLLDVHREINEILNDLVWNFGQYVNKYPLASFMTITKYFVHPELFRRILMFKSREENYVNYEEILKRIKKLPTVPMLLDLARNKARDHIIKTRNITSCSQYITFVNHMPILAIYRKILTFER